MIDYTEVIAELESRKAEIDTAIRVMKGLSQGQGERTKAWDLPSHSVPALVKDASDPLSKPRKSAPARPRTGTGGPGKFNAQDALSVIGERINPSDPLQVACAKCLSDSPRTPIEIFILIKQAGIATTVGSVVSTLGVLYNRKAALKHIADNGKVSYQAFTIKGEFDKGEFDHV